MQMNDNQRIPASREAGEFFGALAEMGSAKSEVG
jgi:hypothetical protein